MQDSSSRVRVQGLVVLGTGDVCAPLLELIAGIVRLLAAGVGVIREGSWTHRFISPGTSVKSSSG